MNSLEAIGEKIKNKNVPIKKLKINSIKNRTQTILRMLILKSVTYSICDLSEKVYIITILNTFISNLGNS